MSERGVFAVDRGIWTDPDFASEPFTEREAFLWLVSEAAWKAHKKRADGKVVDLERGQLCHSVRFMAEAWQWSKSRVDRFLARLENRDMIQRPSGTRTPIITVCNYDAFQRVSLPERDNNGTANGTRTGQERDKLEDIENIKSPSLRSGESTPARKSRKPETEIDPNLQPDEIDIAFAVSKGIPRHLVMDEWERFVNRNVAKGQKYRDWKAAWRTWCGSPYRRTATAPPQQQPRRSAQATFLDIAREADAQTRNPSHEQPLDGEILNPGSGLSATRYAHLTVLERTGADGGQLQPEDYPSQRRTFG